MNNFAAAILPLLGVVLGAVLQFLLSRAAEKGKHHEMLRHEAYSSYLSAVAACAHAGSDEDKASAWKMAVDAKAKILVYGSLRVIEALAQFEKSDAALDNPQSVSEFVPLISAMRPTKEAVCDDDIKVILGLEPDI